jgi:YVTN family beta-propeller protein
MRSNRFLILLLALFAFNSCKKKEVALCPPSTESLNGKILVLNEGLFQQNNSSLSLIDPSSGTVNPSFFESQAGRPLGDTGNDIKRYGDKIYIVVNVSSTIEVLDAKTGLSIKQILMQAGGQAKQPRFIDFHNGKAFISCYDGFVDVLDTTSLNISSRIAVGSNPDHLRVAGNKLYVSNSGGLNFPLVDSTVSVISLSTLSEIKKITVGKNPGSIALAGNGDIYVVSRGDFGANPSRMHRIETIGDTKTEDYPFDGEQLTEINGDLLVFESVGQASVKKFNTSSNSLATADFLSFSGINTPYKVQFVSSLNRVFVMDANGYVNAGFVHTYTSNGAFVEKVKVGLVPSSLLSF